MKNLLLRIFNFLFKDKKQSTKELKTEGSVSCIYFHHCYRYNYHVEKLKSNPNYKNLRLHSLYENQMHQNHVIKLLLEIQDVLIHSHIHDEVSDTSFLKNLFDNEEFIKIIYHAFQLSNMFNDGAINGLIIQITELLEGVEIKEDTSDNISLE